MTVGTQVLMVMVERETAALEMGVAADEAAAADDAGGAAAIEVLA